MDRHEKLLITTVTSVTASAVASIGIRHLMRNAAASGEHTHDQQSRPTEAFRPTTGLSLHITELDLDKLPSSPPDYSRITPTVNTGFSGTQTQRGTGDFDLMSELIAGAHRTTDQLNARQQG